jgi:hypothetical protein
MSLGADFMAQGAQGAAGVDTFVLIGYTCRSVSNKMGVGGRMLLSQRYFIFFCISFSLAERKRNTEQRSTLLPFVLS